MVIKRSMVLLVVSYYNMVFITLVYNSGKQNVLINYWYCMCCRC